MEIIPWEPKHAHLYRSASAADWLTTPTVTRHRPAGQPVSINGQPATPTTDTPCVTVTDTCDFNSIVLMLTLMSAAAFISFFADFTIVTASYFQLCVLLLHIRRS